MKNAESNISELRDCDIFWREGKGHAPETFLFCLVYDNSVATALKSCARTRCCTGTVLLSVESRRVILLTLVAGGKIFSNV